MGTYVFETAVMVRFIQLRIQHHKPQLNPMNSTLPTPINNQVSALVGKKLLVVDDDEALLTAVCKVLQRAGAFVQPARGTPQAISLLADSSGKFDAVLTDLRMPIASGKTILSTIKNTSPSVPVLMMSAFWSDEIKQQCTELGAAWLLDKPLTSMPLLAAVAKALLGVRA